jgi:hypothetical protein
MIRTTKILVRILVPVLLVVGALWNGATPASAGLNGTQTLWGPKVASSTVEACDVDYCTFYSPGLQPVVSWDLEGTWSLNNVGVWGTMDDNNYYISDWACPCTVTSQTTFYDYRGAYAGTVNPPPSYGCGYLNYAPGQTWAGTTCAVGYVQSLAYEGLPAGYATSGFTIWPNGYCGCYGVFNYPASDFGYQLTPGSVARSVGVWPNNRSGEIQYGQGRIFPFHFDPTLDTITTQYDWGTWDIARQIVLCPGSTSNGYELDGYGGIHSLGGAPPITRYAYWSGWDIARSIVVRADCQSGYTLDGWGGVHPFASANVALPPVPRITGYWSGWDIAKWMDYIGPVNGVDSGYVLDGYGGIHPWGNAPTASNYTYWGWNIARAIVTYDNWTSGYVLDGYGGVHPYGSAPAVQSSSGYWAYHDIFRGLAMLPFSRSGYYVDSSTGVLQTFQT